MTPAERIAARDALRARIYPVWGQEDMWRTDRIVDAVLDSLSQADYVIVHCPKGERVVLDRTGDTDRVIRQHAMWPVFNKRTDRNETWWVDSPEGSEQ